MNSCSFCGALGKDWEMKQTANGCVAKSSMAIKEGKDKTTWINLTAFNKQAEMLAQYTGKGQFLAITTSFDPGEYTDKDGNKKSWAQFIVRNITFCGKSNQDQSGGSGYGGNQSGGYQNSGNGQQGGQPYGQNNGQGQNGSFGGSTGNGHNNNGNFQGGQGNGNVGQGNGGGQNFSNGGGTGMPIDDIPFNRA